MQLAKILASYSSLAAYFDFLIERLKFFFECIPSDIDGACMCIDQNVSQHESGPVFPA